MGLAEGAKMPLCWWQASSGAASHGAADDENLFRADIAASSVLTRSYTHNFCAAPIRASERRCVYASSKLKLILSPGQKQHVVELLL
jgi:hypothetical protein